jgi:hypothetical protein
VLLLGFALAAVPFRLGCVLLAATGKPALSPSVIKSTLWSPWRPQPAVDDGGLALKIREIFAPNP